MNVNRRSQEIQQRQEHGIPTLLGIPFDGQSSYLRGAAEAPGKIREALACEASNHWTETGVDLGVKGVYEDSGDIELLGTDAFAAIERAVGELIDNGRRPVSLGGDHSITYPILKAVATKHSALTIFHFDAHPDLYDEFEGNRFSHACPFARIMEAGLAARLVQVGIRTMTRHQRDQADRFGVEVIDMRAWSTGVRPAITDDEILYLSVDVDGIDPAFAPGVSHPEPGGLTVREVVSLIQSLPAQLVAADVVECNPDADPSGVTSYLAAKLVKEIAASMHRELR